MDRIFSFPARSLDVMARCFCNVVFLIRNVYKDVDCFLLNMSIVSKDLQ